MNCGWEVSLLEDQADFMPVARWLLVRLARSLIDTEANIAVIDILISKFFSIGTISEKNILECSLSSELPLISNLNPVLDFSNILKVQIKLFK